MKNQWFAVVALCLLAPLTPAAQLDVAAAAKANLELGVAYLQKGNLAAARDKIERAREQAPRNVSVRSALALLYARLGEVKRADNEFRDALKMAPHEPELLNNYAVFLCGHERSAEGVELFKQAAASPDYRSPWAALTNAGVCLRNAKRYDEAAEQFNKALAIKPAHAEAIYQLADMELLQKQAAAAYARVATYVAGNIPTADLLYLGWRAATELGDKANALKLARRLQTEFPASEQTKALLAGSAGGKSG
jgi:type IV pilus assembly protein PilF